MSETTSSGPTHVVTCFVLRSDADGDRILLVKRSDRVRTYRGAWAAISGYLEPGVCALEQAYTELREEASLDRAEVELVRQGEPIAVNDADTGLNWIVHPFLFRMRRLDTIVTDWEATESQWISPGQLAHLPTVPMLVEAFAAVTTREGGENAARA